MTSLFRTHPAPTTPSHHNRKEGRTMRSLLLKSLLVVPTLAMAVTASSLAIAGDNPLDADGDGWVFQASVQGVDYVYPYTFPDAEQKAIAAVNAWLSQHPNCHITDYTKRFDWVMVNGIQRTRCTITFEYEVLPW